MDNLVAILWILFAIKVAFCSMAFCSIPMFYDMSHWLIAVIDEVMMLFESYQKIHECCDLGAVVGDILACKV